MIAFMHDCTPAYVQQVLPADDSRGCVTVQLVASPLVREPIRRGVNKPAPILEEARAVHGVVFARRLLYKRLTVHRCRDPDIWPRRSVFRAESLGTNRRLRREHR